MTIPKLLLSYFHYFKTVCGAKNQTTAVVMKIVQRYIETGCIMIVCVRQKLVIFASMHYRTVSLIAIQHFYYSLKLTPENHIIVLMLEFYFYGCNQYVCSVTNFGSQIGIIPCYKNNFICEKIYVIICFFQYIK